MNYEKGALLVYKDLRLSGSTPYADELPVETDKTDDDSEPETIIDDSTIDDGSAQEAVIDDTEIGEVTPLEPAPDEITIQNQ